MAKNTVVGAVLIALMKLAFVLTVLSIIVTAATSDLYGSPYEPFIAVFGLAFVVLFVAARAVNTATSREEQE